MELKKIEYATLNGRQKENYNFQKISAVLADYGFVTIRLSDDWNGADFLALHKDGATLKVQLKPRLTFGTKYKGKELWVCFPSRGDWYLYPHDVLLKIVLAETSVGTSESWLIKGVYSMGQPGKRVGGFLERYRVTRVD
jgi:hypothetical protein